MLEIRLLGPLEVRVAGQSLPLGGTKQRAVLAMLALQANQMVSIDRLVEGLWGPEPPETATNTVQVYISRLRRALPTQDQLARSDTAVLQRCKPGYRLTLEPEQLDLQRFERLALMLHEGR